MNNRTRRRTPFVLKQAARIDEHELREFARGWITSERINVHHQPVMMHADINNVEALVPSALS
jgi:hypothetical protein